MSYYLRVYCAADSILDSHQLMEFIQDGYYFDDPPIFENLETAKPPNLFSFDVRYSQELRPISISCTKDADFISEEVELLLAEIPKTLPQKYRMHIESCNLLYCFEVKPDTMAEPAWEMLSCLESFIAKKLNGLIYAPDDGLYDSKLSLIAKTK